VVIVRHEARRFFPSPAAPSRRFLKLLLVAVLLLPLARVSDAAEVTASLDRQQVTEGETVTLVLQTPDPRQSLDAQLDVLEENFHVIDQRSETRMSIVNGRQQAEKRLLITLEPRREGRLTIPALEFPGGERTTALTLSVTAAPSLAPGELPPVFIETELEPAGGPHYVHAQLSLKVRIFYQQNLTEAAINPPAPEQASVRLLDEVPYQAERNGLRFRVLERRYAIFPERSGELLIPPMQLTGRLIERRSDRLWQPSTRGRRVRVESDPVRLEISPRPAVFQGDHWLPARSLSLAQQISDGESVRVGEPVTRTVLIDAVGLEEHMLEEPAWEDLEGARVYPDKPTGISRDDGQWVLGHREFRYAVVPERAGELVLPELRLHWWDTVNDRQQVAIVPGHTVRVLPSELAALNPTGAGPEAVMADPAAAGPATAAGLRVWQAAALVFAILWLATLVLYLRRGPRSADDGGASEAATPGERELLAEFRRACGSGDAATARAALGRWLRSFGPPQARGSLLALAELIDDATLARGLRELDAAGFRPGGGSWEPGGLHGAFEAWRKRARDPRARRVDPYGLYARSG
jgi:hypothetical protein